MHDDEIWAQNALNYKPDVAVLDSHCPSESIMISFYSFHLLFRSGAVTAIVTPIRIIPIHIPATYASEKRDRGREEKKTILHYT